MNVTTQSLGGPHQEIASIMRSAPQMAPMLPSPTVVPSAPPSGSQVTTVTPGASVGPAPVVTGPPGACPSGMTYSTGVGVEGNICNGEDDCYVAANATDGNYCLAPPPTCSGCNFPAISQTGHGVLQTASCQPFPTAQDIATFKGLLATDPSITVESLLHNVPAAQAAAQAACMNAALGLGPAPAANSGGGSAPASSDIVIGGFDLSTIPWYVWAAGGAVLLFALSGQGHR